MDISDLDDDELLARTERIAADIRSSGARFVEHLAELDRRDLTLKRGYGSLYEYALFRLRLSEGAAYRHIRAARAVRSFPALLEMLRDGRLSMDALVLLHPHLKEPDAGALILKAVGLRSRQLEALLAERRTEPPLKEVIRYLGSPPPETPLPGDQPALALMGDPEARGAGTPSAPSGDAPMEAGAPVPAGPAAASAAGRARLRAASRPVRFAFTADEEFLFMVGRARELLRHKYPDGRLEGILRDAMKALLAKKDPFARRGGRSAPRHPRHPQAD